MIREYHTIQLMKSCDIFGSKYMSVIVVYLVAMLSVLTARALYSVGDPQPTCPPDPAGVVVADDKTNDAAVSISFWGHGAGSDPCEVMHIMTVAAGAHPIMRSYNSYSSAAGELWQ
jgi:hypothetical protein